MALRGHAFGFPWVNNQEEVFKKKIPMKKKSLFWMIKIY